MLTIRPPRGLEVEAMHRLRYHVYCVEKGFADAAAFPDGLEIDEHDATAQHFVAFDTDAPTRLMASFRLLRDGLRELPIMRDAKLTSRIPRGATVEISRVIVAPRFRGSCALLSAMLVGTLRYCIDHDVAYVLAIMERPLALAVKRLRYDPIPIGDEQWYMNGPTTPYMFDVHAYARGLLHCHTAVARAS